MSMAVVGMGLVTPFADTPIEHVFFLRAGVPGPPPSPFRLRADGTSVHVRYCRWLGAVAPVEQRLARLLGEATGDALRPAASVTRAERHLMLCLAKPRVGLGPDALETVSESAEAEHASFHAFSGDAGAFAALRDADALLRRGEARLVVVAAVDSFVALDALDHVVRHPPSEWDLPAPPPSEGAAALALMQAHEARRIGAPILGTLAGAATATGAANDDNDAPVDGAGMTVVLRDLPAERQAATAFGPFQVDLLRRDEWSLASARLAERFASGCVFSCLESRVGRLGAASGLANLVYGLAVHRHRAAATAEASDAPFYAWAMSPDGTRGAALLRAGAP